MFFEFNRQISFIDKCAKTKTKRVSSLTRFLERQTAELFILKNETLMRTLVPQLIYNFGIKI
jgi:hypothetical protein